LSKNKNPIKPKTMAPEGAIENPGKLKTLPLTSEYEMYKDETSITKFCHTTCPGLSGDESL
jgi:hypothetical protein